MAQGLKVYRGKDNLNWPSPAFYKGEKTVFVIASNEGTEMFDLMAPFYLFNATGQANVYVVSEEKAPVLLVNSLFILPHYSFREIDSLGIQPDVIVVPNLTVHLKSPPRPSTVAWVRKQYTGKNILLAICDGAATAAATGLYDGLPITTHSSDWGKLEKLYPRGDWKKGLSYTRSGNLYSTAGVSNATEGSLAVIEAMFGQETMLKVMREVRYPHAEVKTGHANETVSAAAIATIVKKVLFKHDRDLGVLLQEGADEFELGSVLDTYSRTFPASLNTFALDGGSVSSKFGLTLLPTGNLQVGRLDELHILRPETFPGEAACPIEYRELVEYGETPKYPFEVCLDRIGSLYGHGFRKAVKLTLDYN
ncbi:hypothetical protein TH63_09470 [Rufibacter radiotolerans]|uniref:DJ-1/PfpI domain-containing protein n=2 Tax=Rufibacter radiotolerans TaxID=1379910 RepID=A0A0H4VJ29_9BACT|nr:hypothetical protein TH63_09470 [Rufibacter radiotolerans]